MLVAYFPEARGIGIGRHALEYQRDGAVGERSVDDIGVPRDPADIGGTPEYIPFMVIKDVLVGDRGVQEITAGGVQNPLGFAGRTRGIEDEQRILGIHDFHRAIVADLCRCLVIPDIAPFVPVDPAAGMAYDDCRVHVRTGLQGGVDVVLQVHGLAAAQPLVGGDHGMTVGIQDPVLDRIGREPAEHDRVNGADAGARQHGDDSFRDHRHVDADTVAFLYVAGLEHVSQAADLFVQLPVSDVRIVGRIVTFPDQGTLVAVRIQMTIDAVVTGIELAALEPADMSLGVVPVEYRIPGLVPVQELLCLLRPESGRILHRVRVHRLVLLRVQVGIAGKCFGYIVDLALSHCLLRGCSWRVVIDR